MRFSALPFGSSRSQDKAPPEQTYPSCERFAVEYNGKRTDTPTVPQAPRLRPIHTARTVR